MISFIELSSVQEYKCFDIQSIWITILFQRISQVNCTSVTFHRKLRKFVIYLFVIIRKGSINYALVSLLFLSLFSSPSFSLVVVVLKRIESRRLFSHASPRYFFRLSGKKTFRIQFLRAGKIIDNGRRRFEAWNFPVSSSEYSLFCRRRGGNVGNAIRGGSDPFFFGYKFPLAPRKKVSRVEVNDILFGNVYTIIFD